MRKIKEVLRLRFDAGLSIRQIASAVKLSTGATQGIVKQAELLELGWPLPADLSEADLEQRFYSDARRSSRVGFEVPDWPVVQREMRRKGMTLQLLWQEYCQANAGRSYSYSQYCERYSQWRKKQRRSMRQSHRAGEKVFVDYAGPTVPIVDPQTGEVTSNANIFVAVLGASNYTYAEATRSQSLPDWLQSHVRMFEFFGGVTEVVVPDNLRSGVSKACRYDPDINPSYQQFGAHYSVAILPARPYKPKDKAKAEVGVQIVERWIMMRLRHHTFFSLAELNFCIAELLKELNARAFKQLPGNRQEAFETLDRPALKPLPRHAYQYVDIKKVKVNIDYHVQYQLHHYSVPHQYVGERLEVHACDALVQMYFRTKLIASHVKQDGVGMTTDPSHMPQRHEKHHKWTPARLRQWAGDIGEDTNLWIDGQLNSKPHPEQAYRVCLGLLNLSRDYPTCRLNAACRLANREGLTQLRNIKSILKSNRDQLQQSLAFEVDLPQSHENVRGPQSFTQDN
jgi:transposase